MMNETIFYFSFRDIFWNEALSKKNIGPKYALYKKIFFLGDLIF